MIIRDALEADLPAIVEIYNAAIRGRISTAQLEPVSVEERLPWFREHSPDSHPLWVAEIDGRIAGWLSFQSFITRSAYRSTAEISVYVNEKFRRRGVGRTLLEKAMAHSPRLESALWSAASSGITSRVCVSSSAWALSVGGSCHASHGWMRSSVTW